MDGIGWAAEAMSAARDRVDIAAENLANGSTDGFHKHDARGFLSAAGVRVSAVPDDAQGALRETGRPLDLALTGRGAFTVRRPDGTLSQTRDGAFSRDRFGRLADAHGGLVLGAGRLPLQVPDDATIDAAGRILRNGAVLGRMALPPGTQVHTGFLESSNVDAIGEMVDLLSAQRAFESAEKVLASIDGTRQRETTQVAVVR
jgi:flagellar basal body rod protein FlgG